MLLNKKTKTKKDVEIVLKENNLYKKIKATVPRQNNSDDVRPGVLRCKKRKRNNHLIM